VWVPTEPSWQLGRLSWSIRPWAWERSSGWSRNSLTATVASAARWRCTLHMGLRRRRRRRRRTAMKSKKSNCTASTSRPSAQVSTRCWQCTASTSSPSSRSSCVTAASPCCHFSRSLASTSRCSRPYWPSCSRLKSRVCVVVKSSTPCILSAPPATQLSRTCFQRYCFAAIECFFISLTPGLCTDSWLIFARSSSSTRLTTAKDSQELKTMWQISRMSGSSTLPKYRWTQSPTQIWSDPFFQWLPKTLAQLTILENLIHQTLKMSGTFPILLGFPCCPTVTSRRRLLTRFSSSERPFAYSRAKEPNRRIAFLSKSFRLSLKL